MNCSLCLFAFAFVTNFIGKHLLRVETNNWFNNTHSRSRSHWRDYEKGRAFKTCCIIQCGIEDNVDIEEYSRTIFILSFHQFFYPFSAITHWHFCKIPSVSYVSVLAWSKLWKIPSDLRNKHSLRKKRHRQQQQRSIKTIIPTIGYW